MSNIDKYETRKKMVYDFMCDDMYVPMKIKELCIVLGVKKEDRPQLEQILLDLQAEGRITLSKRGKYSKSEIKKTVGVFTAHQRGFGFVTVEGEPDDIFIPAEYVNGAMHMDTVEITISPVTTGRRKEGKVVSVIERGMKQVVCTYEASDNFGFAVPDNTRFGTDIFIPKERSKGAMSGHKVVVEITSYGKKGKKPEGKVVEIIGHIDDPGTDILSIVKAYDLPVDFSEKIMHQVQNVAKDVTPADMAGRMDLRDWMMVTIDGEDAKDLDDAVSLYMDGDNYVLGVHIADVSNYVQEHSALDVEALKRGTSVYLVDRVIPMLPRELSNGICSLNEGCDRLALSCIMTINKKGEVIDHKIAETVIKTNRRMTYTNVKKILADKDAAVIEEYKELVPMFEKMAELAAILRKKRMKRGSIDFDFPETKVVLDEDGHPIDIKPYDRNVATKLIEDFMLIANETVAEDYFWQEIPFVYRTHDKPDSEKIAKLSTFINNFGYTLHIGADDPPLRRPVPGAAGNALARRPGRGGLRHGIRAGSAAADIFRPGGVAHRKSRFPGFRAAAGRNLRHAPLPQSGGCAPAADTCFARQGHGRTPDRRPRRQRVFALPEYRHDDRHALHGGHGRQIRGFSDAGTPDRAPSARSRAGPEPAGDACLCGGGALPAGNRKDGRGSDAFAALHLAGRPAETHLLHPCRHRHVTRTPALRPLSPGYRRRLVLHHCHRVDRNGYLIPQGGAEPVYFQKSFDFALDFVPLHRGSLPGQPVMAARGKVIQ